MRKVLMATLLVLIAIGVIACSPAAPAVPAGGDLKAPTVTLNRVEVTGFFPWPAPPPTPTPAPSVSTLNIPLVLGYVFDVANPNATPVTLTSLKFASDFEAAPNEYFTLNTPISQDSMSIPGGATNQLRVTVVYNTAAAFLTLSVTSGARVKSLGLNTNEVITKWWNAPSNPAATGIGYSVRASQGTAEFKTDKGTTVVTFEGKFPK
jgi:hypothetical protein